MTLYKWLIILFAMIFMATIDDFVLQTFLAKGKQKKWWEENYPDKKYRKDYKMCLLLHSFEWSFMVNIPVIIVVWLYHLKDIFNLCIILCLMVLSISHYVIDDLKANKQLINLSNDQVLHIDSILIVWSIYVALSKF